MKIMYIVFVFMLLMPISVLAESDNNIVITCGDKGVYDEITKKCHFHPEISMSCHYGGWFNEETQTCHQHDINTKNQIQVKLDYHEEIHEIQEQKSIIYKIKQYYNQFISSLGIDICLDDIL